MGTEPQNYLLWTSELKYTSEMDDTVLIQPCSHTPTLILSDCPLLCSCQPTAMFVHLVQSVFMQQ